MTDDHHPVDVLLRGLAGSPEPDSADREYVESKLSSEIVRAEAGHRRLLRRPAFAWTAGVLLLVTGVVVAIQVTQPTPAAATIEQIAALAATVEPLTATDSRYVYTESTVQGLGFVTREGLGDVPYEKDLLVYQTHSTRETWYGTQGTVQIRTTYQQPTFFTDTDRAAYYAAGLDRRDQVGKTLTSTDSQSIEQWPADPEALDQAIRKQMVTDRGLPGTAEYLDVAFDIIGESFATPRLRAATLRLIARLEGIQVVDQVGDGSATFALDFTDRQVETRLTFNIDSDGYLRHQQTLNITSDPKYGIPANTATYQAEFSEPKVVNSLDAQSP